jgi:hypothetical protein
VTLNECEQALRWALAPDIEVLPRNPANSFFVLVDPVNKIVTHVTCESALNTLKRAAKALAPTVAP